MKWPATFSEDRVYRYDLQRWWADRPERLVCWIMLNPSTADENRNDPTVRQCIDFSTGWGYDGLVVVNLFALRSPKPAVLKTHPDPVGPSNDAYIYRWATHADVDLVVGAWGAHGTLRNRGLIVRDRLEAAGVQLHALGVTKAGHPWHPLYRPLTTKASPL